MTIKLNDPILKNKFHLDEYILNTFCINTLKACNGVLNKFTLFNTHLHYYHIDKPYLYEESFEEYCSFIIYSILSKSLTGDESVLKLENYFYNVLRGYCIMNKIEIQTAFMAKAWKQLTDTYAYIITLASNPDIASIEYNKIIIGSFSHINAPSNNLYNYYINIPLVLKFKDQSIELVQIIKQKNHTHNIFNTFALNYFKYPFLKTIHYIVIKDGNVLMPVFRYSRKVTIDLNKVYQSSYLDFNKINYNYCHSCPLTCTYSERYLTRYEIKPWAKLNTINTVNI